MEKGKFGFSLWLYPFISLWMLLIGQPLGALLILGFVIAVEKNEWAIKQSAHVVMLSIFWSVYNILMDGVSGLLGGLSGGMSIFSMFGGGGGLAIAPLVLDIITGLVWAAMVVLVIILGLLRLRNGQNIGLPGKGIIDRAYGIYQNYAQPQWGGYQNQQQQPYQQPPQQQQWQQQQPYQQPQQPQQQWQQPVQQQYQQAPPPPPPQGNNAPPPPPPPPRA